MDPGTRAGGRSDDGQLPRPHGARHRGAVPDEGAGAHRGGHGHRVLRILVELCAAADSRRHLSRPVRHAHHLLARADALVGLHRLHGRRGQPADAVVRAHRRRHVRGAVLPRQQPHPRDLVSAAGARPRQLDLFGRAVRRHRVLERAAVLGDATIRLARPVLSRRRLRHRARGADVVALSRAKRRSARRRRGAGPHRGRRRR